MLNAKFKGNRKIEANWWGDKYWLVNELFHREKGPAIERIDGTKEWRINGKFHREDGPAIECKSGTKWWFINGVYHREDGPAAEYSNGSKSWYLHGIHFTKEQYDQILFKRKLNERIEKAMQNMPDSMMKTMLIKKSSLLLGTGICNSFLRVWNFFKVFMDRFKNA